jgi:hypothetical protein
MLSEVNNLMKTFIVLGMHRSATSLAAKGLYYNIFMGDNFLSKDESQPYGYYEDTDFVHLNDEILEKAGGSWSNPPSHEAILAQALPFEDKIKDLISKKEIKAEKYAQQRKLIEPCWGWKDPRTTLTIELYMPHVKSPHILACFRNPKDIAISLCKRNCKWDELSEESQSALIELQMPLIKCYNERLVNFIQKHY